MPFAFLTPPVERLGADGVFEPLGRGGGAWRRPLILLARELCSFELHEPLAGGAAGAAAARLHARTSAPFLNAGWLVRRAGSAFAVWWWDMDRVGPLVEARFGAVQPRLAPETLAQPKGSGWRIVRLSSGYEAQLWSSSALVASGWRPDRFDAAAWDAFVRVQRHADTPPPEVLPPAESLPFVMPPGLGLVAFGELTAGDIGVGAGLAGACLLIGAASLFAGQGLRLNAMARSAEAEAQAVRAAAPRRALVRDEAAGQRLAAFRALAARPSPVAALSTALGVLQLYGVEPQAYRVDAASLSLTLPYSAMANIDRIALELEGTGVFAEVHPSPDSQAKTIDLQMRLVAPRRAPNPSG